MPKPPKTSNAYWTHLWGKLVTRLSVQAMFVYAHGGDGAPIVRRAYAAHLRAMEALGRPEGLLRRA